jgi:hypothetical protein
MSEAFILAGVRTAVGRYGGALSHIRTDGLLRQTMVAACAKAGVELDRIEDVAAGCVNLAHQGMGDIALGRSRRRLPGFRAGGDRQPVLRLVVLRDPRCLVSTVDADGHPNLARSCASRSRTRGAVLRIG